MEEDRAPPLPLARQLPLDRSALERVLARAAELQSMETDTGEHGLTEDQLIDVGKEVGLSSQHLRQALAEERGRIVLPTEEGWRAKVMGPRSASASRTVPGKPEEVLATLDRWMQKEECLQIKRRFADRTVWEARRDIVGAVKQGLGIGGRGYHLTRAHDVSATVVAVDADRVLVRLDADLSSARTARAQAGAASVIAGMGAGGVIVVLGVLVPVALAPVIVGCAIGYASVRSQVGVVTRAQLALEQVLDQFEHGQLTASTPSVGDVIRAVVKAKW